MVARSFASVQIAHAVCRQGVGRSRDAKPDAKGATVVKKLSAWPILVMACSPDVPRDPPPSAAVVVEFDPGAATPVIPLPNDLAIDPVTGKVVVPPVAGASAAQNEFNAAYLSTLDGFPQESSATVSLSGDLDPSTVTPASVMTFDVTSGVPAPVALTPAYGNRVITLSPPSGGWTRGHRYAVLLLAGQGGLRGAAGEPVIGSPTWALVSGENALVTCEDLASSDCLPAVDVVPSDETDPAKRLADQTAKAKRLEQLRRAYAPFFQLLATQGVARADVPGFWTFRIVDAGEMTFDPASSVIPFPHDVLLQNGKVALPNPITKRPFTEAECANPTELLFQLYCGLNTLDGFSTITAPISENSDALGPVSQGNIDPTTLSPRAAGLVALRSALPDAARTTPSFTPCLNCVSSPVEPGAPAPPEQLQWRLDAPLDEKTTYLAYVTSDVRDDKGIPVVANPVFALLRGAAPLLENGKSTVSLIDDAQAAQLEPLRAAMAPALDALEAQGVARSRLALAFPFTTQSEGSLLDVLHGYPAQVPGLPTDPLALVDATEDYVGAAASAGISVDGVGKFFAGTFVTPVAITGPGGTLDPQAPKPTPVNVVVAVPAAAPPSSGYPLTVFGHGLSGSRNDVLALAGSLAASGRVAVAADFVFHGDRTTCTGSSVVTSQPSDDAACADAATMRCDEGAPQGLCVLRSGARAPCSGGTADLTCAAAGQGRCAADGLCQGAGADLRRNAAGKPAISGWNILNLTNFFATRDNFRQSVIDLAQLVRVVRGTGATSFGGRLATANGAAVPLDATRIDYVGVSLGGILGSLFNAVSPDTTRVMLNVPGGALPRIILTAEAFASQRSALLATLAGLGIQSGTPAFDQFIGIAQWVLDPADPANVGWRLTHGIDVGGVRTPNADRSTFIQFIEGDQVVPNVANFALVTAANRAFVSTPPSFGCAPPLLCYEFTESLDAFDATSATPATRHAFLAIPPTGARGAALTSKARAQLERFLTTGSIQ